MLVWLAVLELVATATALDNGLSLTPPMGWLSWLYSGCSTDCAKEPKRCLSEQLIKRTADRMVSDGYKDAGYEYIIIDDCWPEWERGPDGRIIPDKTRFKSGMKALADYVHSKGLKFGIYGDIGSTTCAGYPGFAGHESLDVHTFAEWGVDYIKVDGCNEEPKYFNKTYPKLGKLLNQTGRPIHYSCSWPAYQEQKGHMKVDYKAISETCNTWRNYNDVGASWESVLSIMDWFADNIHRLAPYSGPGHFHDPDMLIMGYPGVPELAAELQFYVWSCLAAPLMISADLDTITDNQKRVLQNQFLIGYDQDKGGSMGYRFSHNDTFDTWVRPSTVRDSTLVISFYRNLSYSAGLFDTVAIKLPLKQIGLQSGTYYQVKQAVVGTTEIVYIENEYEFTLSSKGVTAFELSPLNNYVPSEEDNNIL